MQVKPVFPPEIPDGQTLIGEAKSLEFANLLSVLLQTNTFQGGGVASLPGDISQEFFSEDSRFPVSESGEWSEEEWVAAFYQYIICQDSVISSAGLADKVVPITNQESDETLSLSVAELAENQGNQQNQCQRGGQIGPPEIEPHPREVSVVLPIPEPEIDAELLTKQPEHSDDKTVRGFPASLEYPEYPSAHVPDQLNLQTSSQPAIQDAALEIDEARPQALQSQVNSAVASPDIKRPELLVPIEEEVMHPETGRDAVRVASFTPTPQPKVVPRVDTTHSQGDYSSKSSPVHLAGTDHYPGGDSIQFSGSQTSLQEQALIGEQNSQSFSNLPENLAGLGEEEVAQIKRILTGTSLASEDSGKADRSETGLTGNRGEPRLVHPDSIQDPVVSDKPGDKGSAVQDFGSIASELPGSYTEGKEKLASYRQTESAEKVPPDYSEPVNFANFNTPQVAETSRPQVMTVSATELEQIPAYVFRQAETFQGERQIIFKLDPPELGQVLVTIREQSDKGLEARLVLDKNIPQQQVDALAARCAEINKPELIIKVEVASTFANSTGRQGNSTAKKERSRQDTRRTPQPIKHSTVLYG